jgi:hypothetical protein
MSAGDCNVSVDLILSLSKDEVAAPNLPKPSILRQAQDEDFGETLLAVQAGATA